VNKDDRVIVMSEGHQKGRGDQVGVREDSLRSKLPQPCSLEGWAGILQGVEG